MKSKPNFNEEGPEEYRDCLNGKAPSLLAKVRPDLALFLSLFRNRFVADIERPKEAKRMRRRAFVNGFHRCGSDRCH